MTNDNEMKEHTTTISATTTTKRQQYKNENQIFGVV